MATYPGPGAAGVPELNTADEAARLLPDESEIVSYGGINRTSEVDSLPTDTVESTGGKDNDDESKVESGVYATISIMLLGVFLSQTDATLVLATCGRISSEFNQLDSGSWILSAYILAQCAAQPLYGKLSDIYGRKACLQASYILFAIGTAGVGLSQSLGHVIASRAIQGAGGSGMLSMVSIIITDLVPVHEVASVRSYVNILQTTGRSCGGVVGGYLTQKIGWRWAFGIQVPPVLVAIMLVQWRLNLESGDKVQQSKWEKLKRVDFIGAFFLCFGITAICFVLDVGGQKLPMNSPVIIGMATGGAVSLLGFIVSAKLVAEPIFPLHLLGHYVVVTNYIVSLLGLLTQLSLMMLVPVYFQVTSRSSLAAAGAYLIPAFVGNTLGALLSGYWIKRTGLYKPPTVLSPIMSVLSMCLCYFFWNGDTHFLGSLAILPGGFAAGVIGSSPFVGLAAGVPQADMSVAASGMYLCFNLGSIAGASIGAAVYQQAKIYGLDCALEGISNKEEIIQRALKDISYVQNASEAQRKRLVPAFVYAFHQVNLMGLICSCVALFVAVFTRGHRLKH